MHFLHRKQTSTQTITTIMKSNMSSPWWEIFVFCLLLFSHFDWSRGEKKTDISHPWKISPSPPRTQTSDNLQTTQLLTSYQTVRKITNPNPSQLMVEDSPLSLRIPSSDHFDVPQHGSHCNWKWEDLRQTIGWDDNACLFIPSQSNVAVSTKGTGTGFRSR